MPESYNRLLMVKDKEIYLWDLVQKLEANAENYVSPNCSSVRQLASLMQGLSVLPLNHYWRFHNVYLAFGKQKSKVWDFRIRVILSLSENNLTKFIYYKSILNLKSDGEKVEAAEMLKNILDKWKFLWEPSAQFWCTQLYLQLNRLLKSLKLSITFEDLQDSILVPKNHLDFQFETEIRNTLIPSLQKDMDHLLNNSSTILRTEQILNYAWAQIKAWDKEQNDLGGNSGITTGNI